MKRCSIYFLNVFLWKKVIEEIEAVSNSSGLTANVEMYYARTMCGNDLDLIFRKYYFSQSEKYVKYEKIRWNITNPY